MMKNYCAWCWAKIENTLERYREEGNMCDRCSLRVSRVMSPYYIKKGKRKRKIVNPFHLTKAQADEQLLHARLSNY